jgi:hypothetical protein
MAPVQIAVPANPNVDKYRNPLQFTNPALIDDILDGSVFGGPPLITNVDSSAAPVINDVPVGKNPIVLLNTIDNDDIPDPANILSPLKALNRPSVDKYFKPVQLKNALLFIVVILDGSVLGGRSFILNVDKFVAPENALAASVENIELHLSSMDDINDPVNAFDAIDISGPAVDK